MDRFWFSAGDPRLAGFYSAEEFRTLQEVRRGRARTRLSFDAILCQLPTTTGVMS